MAPLTHGSGHGNSVQMGSHAGLLVLACGCCFYMLTLSVFSWRGETNAVEEDDTIEAIRQHHALIVNGVGHFLGPYDNHPVGDMDLTG